jgi:chaperone modulatory protein CbpM
MENEALIPVEEFCIHHQVEISFVHSLFDAGLIEATVIETKLFLLSDQLERLEKFSRLHYDLDINLEGIDTIAHLLNRVKDMQKKINQLNQRLTLYE